VSDNGIDRGPPGCCICGLQFGDEGKGQIVDYLAGDFDVVARYNGGANAGHSIWLGDRRKAFHLMPSGILRDGVLNVIGNGTAVDPAQLLKEMDELEREGYAVDPGRLAISDRAHVVMPYHKIEDELMDRAFASGENGELGTTRRGIGPCYADKAHRVTAVRMADIKDRPYLSSRLPRLVSLKNSLLGALAAESGRTFRQLECEPIMEQCEAWGSRLAPFITDTAHVLETARRSGKGILFEGAHAALLDVDFGTYPYCTSSVCSPGGALAGTGLTAASLSDVVGVAKLYMSRVGAGPFPTEIQGEAVARIRDAGSEYGTSTGRPRSIGWLDLVALRHTAQVTGVTALAVTGLGVLSTLSELRVCVGYSLGTERIDRVPANVRRLGDVQPQYEELEPVGGPLDGVSKRSDLPSGARQLIDRVESFVNVPVRFICVSKGRAGVISE
jgi:adenylosuccinate synthase